MVQFISAGEAAAKLGVSSRRVRQLIHEGELEASRVGNSWAVSVASVERRLRHEPSPGRPLGSGTAWATALYADGLVDRLVSEIGREGAHDLAENARPSSAVQLEDALAEICGYNAARVLESAAARRRVESALHGALAAVRSLSAKEKAIEGHLEELLEMEERAHYHLSPVSERLDDSWEDPRPQADRLAIKRLRNVLAHGREADPKDLAPFRSRSEGVRGHYAHPSVMDALSGDRFIVTSGAHAAHAYGADIVPGSRFEGYVKSSLAPQIVEKYALLNAPLAEANVLLRPVPSLHVKFGFAPRLLVAADLLESPDPRSHPAASSLLSILIVALEWHDAA